MYTSTKSIDDLVNSHQIYKMIELEKIQECIKDYPLDKLLGKGDFGRTYAIRGDDSIAMKIVLLQNRKAMTEFENETRVQKILGDHDVAPKIHDV